MGTRWSYDGRGDAYPHAESRRRYGSDSSVRNALSLLGLILALPVLVPFSVARTAARRPYVVAPVVVIAGMAASTVAPWLWSWLAVYGVLLAVGAVVLLVWLRVSPAAHELLGAAWVPHVRGWWTYRRRWRRLMMAAWLDDGCGVTGFVPELLRVLTRGDVDHLLIRPLAGQTSVEWMARSASLAAALGRPWVRVHPGYNGTLWIAVPRRADVSAGDVVALPVDTPVTSAVHTGMRTPVHTVHSHVPASVHTPVHTVHTPALRPTEQGEPVVITTAMSPRSFSVLPGHTPGGVHAAPGRTDSDHDGDPLHAVGGADHG